MVIDLDSDEEQAAPPRTTAPTRSSESEESLQPTLIRRRTRAQTRRTEEGVADSASPPEKEAEVEQPPRTEIVPTGEGAAEARDKGPAQEGEGDSDDGPGVLILRHAMYQGISPAIQNTSPHMEN